MAKKKMIMRKLLSCFVVFVILMSTFSVAALATESSNDTDISTAKTVSSLGYCSYVWIEITDKYCKGYEVYVDGVYQFTEGESGTPDGYCRFKATPGYHTFKLTLNGKEVSKGWNCQCGTGYNWMSMNDMIPHWCEGSNDNNNQHEVKFRGEVTYDSNTLGAGTYIVTVDEVLYDPQDYFKWSGDAEVNWGIWKDGPYVENADVGDKVELFGRYTKYDDGIHVVDLETSSHYLKKIDSESLSISVWTDKSEYKIGETVTINYQTNKKCTAKLTITKPDGGDIVYGPNEIPASTRSKSATAGYPTGKRTVVFEAWAGDEYKKATCYFDVVEEKKPDLIVSSINFNPNPANKDDDVIVSVTVKNQGNGDAGPHYEFLGYPDRFTLLKEWYCSGLKVGASRTFTHTLENVQQSDTYEACADWGQVVQESNENNNCLTANLEVKKSEEKSDLIIQDITCSPSSPKQGDTITFTVKIKNQGSGSAGVSYVYYYIDGSDVDSDTVPSLSVGSTSTQSFTWTANKCGDVQVKAVADALGEIEESNEGNNQKIETVNVVCPKKQVHNINTSKDFATIQAAINDSDTSPGNTITVDPGTYTENVDVTKSLTIKSTSGNPKDTIVQAAVSNQNYQNVFTVTADNVHIDGFTIKGASYFWCSGIWLDSNNCIISNNTFEGNAIGIWIHPPSLGNNVIRNNKFSSSSGYSPSTTLYLEAANNKIYLNNFIIGMEWGSGNVWNTPTQITYEYEGNTFTNYLGNYRDDYTDTDVNGDGIWDTPYSIDSDKDNYPLVGRFENYVSVEEKPEIKFIGTFEYSRPIWNGGAQQYFFSVDKVLIGKDVTCSQADIVIPVMEPNEKDVTCSQADIVIPVMEPNEKLDAISSILKTLKKGDTVLIYAELKSQVMICDLDFSSDKYYVHRYSTDLEEEYTKFLSDIDSFYFHYSINALGHASWEGKSYDEKIEAINELEQLFTEPTVSDAAVNIVAFFCPVAGILLSAVNKGSTGLVIVKVAFHKVYEALFKDIAETLKASDAVTLQNRILNLAGNGDQLKEKLEQEEDITSLLETRRDKLIKAYKTQSTLDQQFFDYLQGSTYSFKIRDYQVLFGLTVTLNTKLEQDFAFTTALLNSYTNKNQEAELQKAAGCSLNSHIMTAFDGKTYCFGYLHSTKETDTYTVQLTKEGYFGITPNPDGPGLIFILKKEGIQYRGGVSKEGVRVYIPSGVYKLEVSSWSDAPTGYIFCPYGDNLQISCD